MASFWKKLLDCLLTGLVGWAIGTVIFSQLYIPLLPHTFTFALLYNWSFLACIGGFMLYGYILHYLPAFFPGFSAKKEG